MCCTERKYKAKIFFNKAGQLQFQSLLSTAVNPNECSPSHPSHSIQPNDPLYLPLCDAEKHTVLINCWFVIVIFDLLCQQEAQKATNPPAQHTLLDRLTSYILWNFLFQVNFVLCGPALTINILMSHLSHDQLPINSITNNHTVKLNPSHCYAVHLIL